MAIDNLSARFDIRCHIVHRKPYIRAKFLRQTIKKDIFIITSAQPRALCCWKSPVRKTAVFNILKKTDIMNQCNNFNIMTVRQHFLKAVPIHR